MKEAKRDPNGEEAITILKKVYKTNNEAEIARQLEISKERLNNWNRKIPVLMYNLIKKLEEGFAR